MKSQKKHIFSHDFFSISICSIEPSHSDFLLQRKKIISQNFFSFFDNIFADSKKRPTFALAIENNQRLF